MKRGVNPVVRVRAKVQSSQLPRIVVQRSNRALYGRLIKPNGVVVTSLSDKGLLGTRMERALLLGKRVGEAALKAHITKVVFDRGPYRYHGLVKQIAAGAREVGMQF